MSEWTNCRRSSRRTSSSKPRSSNPVGMPSNQRYGRGTRGTASGDAGPDGEADLSHAAPSGVDAVGRGHKPRTGSGNRIIDVEGKWRFTHEDLTQNQEASSPDTLAGVDWNQPWHAVLGEYSATSYGGIIGIASDAVASACCRPARSAPPRRSTRRVATPRRRHHPARNASSRTALRVRSRARPARLHRGRVVARPIRRDPERHDLGIIVVEAAGNGAENLDDALYQTSAGVPVGWKTRSVARIATPAPSSSEPAHRHPALMAAITDPTGRVSTFRTGARS